MLSQDESLGETVFGSSFLMSVEMQKHFARNLCSTDNFPIITGLVYFSAIY